MKIAQRLLAMIAIAALYVETARAERVNITTAAGGFITITPGTPIRIKTGPAYLMNRWMIQVRPNAGTAGVVYVMLGVPLNKTCSATNAAHLSATLFAATATAPGGTLSDPQGANGNTISDAEDFTLACVDGAQADTITVTGWHQN